MVDPTSRLTPQEEKDLNKFQKFFSYKVVQVIVQSRLGEKISATSKPNAMGYDWFNLAINDIQEVLEETKKIMANNKLPSRNNPLCVEVSLKTNEGNTMVLETWRLGIDEKRENNSKITYTVYNRMGVLLKSLIAVSRATPAYKIARNQGHDYIMCYRIYFGQVRVSEFGENYHVIPVGSIGTPRGGLTLSVAYRTKLALPQSNSQASDRLGPSNDVTPQLGSITDSGMQYPVAMTSEFRHHIVEEIASAVADTDLSGSNLSPQTFNTTASTAPSILVEPSSPTKTNQQASESQNITQRKSTRREFKRTFSETKDSREAMHAAFVAQGKTCSAGGITPLSSTPPFASLLLNKSNSSQTSSSSGHQKEHENQAVKNTKTSTNTSQSALEDDFIMVELKAAFAPETSSTDLTQFYRECQNAPPLQLFDHAAPQPLSTVMDTFSDELGVFEQNMKNFDEFVDQLENKKDVIPNKSGEK